jgi:hypothetical protein
MKRNCPAFKDKCNKCGRKGHWKIKCRKNSMQNNPSEKKHNDRKKQFHTVQEDASDENYTFETIGLKEGVCVNTINSVINNDDIIISVHAQTPNANGYLQCKLDTGAQGNLIPLNCLQAFDKTLFKDNRPIYGNYIEEKPQTKLYAYNDGEIKHYGAVTLKLRYNSDKWFIAQFYIVNNNSKTCIIGKKTSTEMGLITVNINTIEQMKKAQPLNLAQLLSEYPDRFRGIGKFDGICHIQLKRDAVPVVTPPRRFPIHLQKEMVQELEKMVELDVLEPVPPGESCEWLNSLACARKESGKLRICLDPRNLNKSIKRTYHRTLTVEEVTHKLAHANYFSKLDAKHGYWSIQLVNESSKLTTFARYRFKRLPFGLNM